MKYSIATELRGGYSVHFLGGGGAAATLNLLPRGEGVTPLFSNHLWHSTHHCQCDVTATRQGFAWLAQFSMGTPLMGNKEKANT